MKTLLPELPAAYRSLASHAGRMQQPSAAGKWWEVKAAADSDEAELLIYDPIAWYAVDAGEVVRELGKVTASTIHVRINSLGGEVFGGVAIYNALVRHKAQVVVHVDGVAASIASLIAMAGDEIRMGDGTFMMIHAPWVLALGNAPELREIAEWLDKIAASMAGIYAERSGLPLAEVLTIMETDTWLSAEEAEDKGFADALDEEAAAEARFDLSGFANVPEKLANAAEDKPQPKTRREAEKYMRDTHKLSHAEARRAVDAVWDALAPREEAPKADIPQPREEAPNEAAGDSAAVETLLATLLTARCDIATRNLKERFQHG